MLELIQVVIGGAFTKLIEQFGVVFVGPGVYPPPGVSDWGSRGETVLEALHGDIAGALDLEAIALAGVACGNASQAGGVGGVCGAGGRVGSGAGIERDAVGGGCAARLVGIGGSDVVSRVGGGGDASEDVATAILQGDVAARAIGGVEGGIWRMDGLISGRVAWKTSPSNGGAYVCHYWSWHARLSGTWNRS